jgi:hypothetical protein
MSLRVCPLRWIEKLYWKRGFSIQIFPKLHASENSLELTLNYYKPVN